MDSKPTMVLTVVVSLSNHQNELKDMESSTENSTFGSYVLKNSLVMFSLSVCIRFPRREEMVIE